MKNSTEIFLALLKPLIFGALLVAAMWFSCTAYNECVEATGARIACWKLFAK